MIAVTAITMLGHFSFSPTSRRSCCGPGVAEASIGPALLLYGAVGLVGLLLTGLIADRAPRLGLVLGSASTGRLTTPSWRSAGPCSPSRSPAPPAPVSRSGRCPYCCRP